MTFSKKKRCDVAAMILFPIAAVFLTVVFDTNLFTSVLLFFGLPALYISLRNPGIARKSFTIAFIFSIPLSLFFDALAAVDGSWVVPQSIFPFRFFGVATVEVYLFSLLWVFAAILLYEHFLDKGRSRDSVSPYLKWLVYICSVLVLAVLLYYFAYGNVPRVPYFYAIAGLVSVFLPLCMFLFRYKKFTGHFILAGVYFFYLLILFEFAALETGQWIFPGEHFLGFVSFFGHKVPSEEFFVWMMAATPALLAYYEFYADDLTLRS